jgi:NTE family protein
MGEPMMGARVGSVLLALLALGCLSPPPANQPIKSWDPASALARAPVASPDRSDEILFALTFSGGGTRAAAFAYGVLEELAEIEVGVEGAPRRLIDEIDLISSVSGGSFTAAYFGLHGDGIFESFEEVFLRKNVQAGLVLEVLRPRYWLGILGTDRSQLAARYYDREVFDRATFADLGRPGAPQVILNATDLSTAGRFPFSPLWFGMICSDLGRFPVSHAVTASSAVPIVFPTIRLRNFAGRCGFELPEWAQEQERQTALGRLVREDVHEAYTNSAARPYIHLVDGGISDNLGLANAVAALSAVGDPERAAREIRHENVRLILIVTVNAEVQTERPWDQADKAASARQVVSGLSGAQIHNTNRLTLELARQEFSDWARELSRPGAPVRFELVDVSFAKLEDLAEREYMQGIETSFHLSDEKVDRLIAAGRRLVRDSPELARALRHLGNHGSPSTDRP